MSVDELTSKITDAIYAEPWKNKKEIAHVVGVSDNYATVTLHRSGLSFSNIKRDAIKLQGKLLAALREANNILLEQNNALLVDRYGS